MKIIAVRHGQTDWNALGKIQGNMDFPLNEKGREQAHQTAQLLQPGTVDVVMASTLKRAVETAEIISEQLGINGEVIKDKRLCERDFGDYDGLPFKDVDILALRSYNANVAIPNGETIREVAARVFECLDEIIRKYSGKNVLLVLHGHVIRAALWYFEGFPSAETEDPSFDIANCAVYEFEVEENKCH